MSNANTKTACPVCGPTPTTLMGECHDLPVVCCDECQLMFVGECNNVKDTEDFFRSEHVEDSEDTREHYVNFRKTSLDREASIVRRLKPEGGRLLDVGTASGCFLNSFTGEEEWITEGVEPSIISARFAQEEFGLNVHQGYLSEQQYDDSTFDIVTSLDAFNCHRTPNDDLAEIYRVLKPGGYFAIEIPGQNYRMLTGSGPLCRLLFGCDLRLNAGVNFYFYTTTALSTMAAKVGFELIESHPEAMPSHGSLPARMAKNVYYSATSLLYKLTGGRTHYAPKEFLIFQKPEMTATIKFDSAANVSTDETPRTLRSAA